MVFESLVVDLFNKYFSDIVENLDRSQLKVGILKGMFCVSAFITHEWEGSIDLWSAYYPDLSVYISNFLISIDLECPFYSKLKIKCYKGIKCWNERWKFQKYTLQSLQCKRKVTKKHNIHDLWPPTQVLLSWRNIKICVN